MLQDKVEHFQWLPIAAGSSMRHERNIARCKGDRAPAFCPRCYCL